MKNITPLCAYIAGPMRGIPQYNFPAFDRAQALLEAAGLTVVNPAELDREVGITEDTKLLPKNFVRQALRRDLLAILETCNLLVVLEDWKFSLGACAEVGLAFALSIPVLELVIPKPEADCDDFWLLPIINQKGTIDT